MSGLRTERVTLEITQRAESYAPCRDLDWQRMLRQTPGGLFPGESVRVVEDADAARDEAIAHGATLNALAEARESLAAANRGIDRLTAERDAALRHIAATEQSRRDAIRERDAARADAEHDVREVLAFARLERDAAKEECERLRAERDDALLVLPACCGRLSDAAATVIQERDHARSRVAELLKDCETYGRAVLALQNQCDLANDRVAELEAAAAPAANAGGEQQEPVAWGVMVNGKIDRSAGSDALFVGKDEADDWCGAAALYGMGTVVSLYAAPQPPRGWLTEKERDAVDHAADIIEDMEDDDGSSLKRKADVLRALLARSTPPKVTVPEWMHDDVRRAVVAAIREAGAEVE